MAALSRYMSGSLASTTRSALRFCTRKTTLSEGAAGLRRGVGGSSMPASVPSSNTASFSARSFVESRGSGAFFKRLPGEVACIKSLIPLHNATASARLVSQLSTTALDFLQDPVFIMVLPLFVWMTFPALITSFGLVDSLGVLVKNATLSMFEKIRVSHKLG